MIVQPLSIARNTFIESLRQPVLILIVMISAFFQMFNTWNTGFSMGESESGEVRGDNKLLFDIGLATIFACGSLLAGFIATAVVSKEIENKTVLTIISKPVSRPMLILGKFVGVAGAIVMAVIPMVIFLLVCLRHEVMSTAADELDQPVIVYTLSAVFLSLGIATWCNFFYGWSFPQTGITLLVPLMLVAYLLILMTSKKWHLQPLWTDFKPQVTLACSCLVLAILVLTAIATAASTRLNQVMTIVVCIGAFFASLLSNHFVGRFVFQNQTIGMIQEASADDSERATFQQPGDRFTLKLEQAPKKPISRGDPFYFSPSPNGYPMLTAPFSRFNGNIDDANELLGPGAAPGLIITSVERQIIKVRHIGGSPLNVVRAPEAGDYMFTTPTRINAAALAAWGVIPNMHFFWLLDAVSQNRPVPGNYVWLATLYASSQIIVFLSIAVILFQKRDVG